MHMLFCVHVWDVGVCVGVRWWRWGGGGGVCIVYVGHVGLWLHTSLRVHMRGYELLSIGTYGTLFMHTPTPPCSIYTHPLPPTAPPPSLPPTPTFSLVPFDTPPATPSTRHQTTVVAASTQVSLAVCLTWEPLGPRVGWGPLVCWTCTHIPHG